MIEEFFFSFSINNMVSLLVGMGILILGIIAYRARSRSQLNRAFLALSVSVALWILAVIARFSISNSYILILISARFTFVGATFLGLYLYYFTYHFPIKKNYKPPCLLLNILAVLIACISLFTPHIVKRIDIIEGIQYNKYGLVYYIFVLYFISLFIGSAYNLVSKIKGLDSLQRTQMFFVLAGFSFSMVLGMISNLFIPLVTGTTKSSLMGPSTVVFFIGFTTYAIIKHRVMNIRLVITRSLLFSILVIVVSSVFTLAVLLARQLVDITDRSTLILVNVIVAIIVVLFLNPLRNFLANQTDRIFFKGQVDHQEVARRLTDLIAHLLERDQLLYQFVRQLKSEFKLKKAEVLFCYNHSQACSLYYSFTPKKFKGTASPEIKRHLWNEYQHLISFFRRYSEIKVREEEARKLEDLKPSLYQRQLAKAVEDLERRSIAVVVPTLSGHKERAFIFLGDKSSGDIFDNRDIRLLELLRSQLTSALEKSGLYEEVKAFSAELEKKVEAATLGLRQANQRLRQLDKAKTLFLSIASHQLRTPLAGIKGFLSMVLEEDFGHLPPKIKQILSEVYANTNKLIRLVNTFLNVSRIESGRLSILKMKCDLVAMTKRIVDELQFMAQDKELKLSLETSHDQIIAEVDADKLEDVLINLIDNAIKYTVRGSIVVRLIDQKTTVRFAVQDTGQGLTKAESQELFNKFVRGSRAMTLNTDGSGLGLYIAKRITEMHKGKIGIESKGAGKGTTFWFELPKK